MAWVLRAKNSWLKRIINKQTGLTSDTLTVDELHEAEKWICRMVQEETYAEEIAALSKSAKVVLLALLVAAASASPVAQDSTAINYGDAITQFLQAWKKMLPCGYAPYDIPVMAPLTNDFSSFQYSKGENLISCSQKASFDVLFPEIQILGSFAIEGVMSMLGIAFPVREVSLVNERFQQLRFVGEYTFGLSLTNPSGLRISEYHLQFYLGDVKIDNWHKLWDISLNDYANLWSSQMMNLLVKQIQPNVDQLLATYAMPNINAFLSAFSLNQLSQLFVNMANNWNSANCQVQA
ncbi:hypothetical protein ACLKA7_008109 [Drosophila subpalustris]